MALLMGITIPAGMEIIYNKTLRMYDISVLCNVGKNPIWFPRSQKILLKNITYLYDIAYRWASLTQDVKDEWNYAANIIGNQRYSLFVQDTSYRKKNGIAGIAIPSIYHQYLVGHINIAAPATSAKIVQYNYHKIYFPASFELCYHTNLTAAGPDPKAKITLTWNNYVSGDTIERPEIIEMPMISGWDKNSKQITSYSGSKGKWRIEIELTDVTGDLWFDNIFVNYNGALNINDPYCLDVVKWWKGENIGPGVTFETVYPTGGAL